MTDEEFTSVREALQLTHKVMRTHEQVRARFEQDGARAARSHAAILNDVIGAWMPDNPGRLPDDGVHIINLSIEGQTSRFSRPPAVPVRLCLLAGTLPGAATAQVLLARPSETVVALSRLAGADEVTQVVETLKAAIPAWSRAGDGATFPSYRPVARSDYWCPRPAWTVTQNGLVPKPLEPAPAVDFSTAVVLTVPGPADASDVVANLWSSLHDGGRRPAGAFPLRTVEMWAWAAVDGLIDTLGLVAARSGAAFTGTGWGTSRENMLGQIRARLNNPGAVLSDELYTSMWKRLGIRRVTAEEQDTVVIELDRDAPLRVELVPAWFPEGGPPARAIHTAERTVVEVNVAARPAEAEPEVWSCLVRGLAQPRMTSPPTIGGLCWPMEPSLVEATSARLAGLTERYERAAAFAGELSGS